MADKPTRREASGRDDVTHDTAREANARSVGQQLLTAERIYTRLKLVLEKGPIAYSDIMDEDTELVALCTQLQQRGYLNPTDIKNLNDIIAKRVALIGFTGRLYDSIITDNDNSPTVSIFKRNFEACIELRRLLEQNLGKEKYRPNNESKRDKKAEEHVPKFILPRLADEVSEIEAACNTCTPDDTLKQARAFLDKLYPITRGQYSDEMENADRKLLVLSVSLANYPDLAERYRAALINIVEERIVINEDRKARIRNGKLHQNNRSYANLVKFLYNPGLLGETAIVLKSKLLG